MRTRQKSYHTADRADLGGLATVGANTLIENLLAHAVLEHAVEGRTNVTGVEGLIKLVTHFDAQLIQRCAALFFQEALLQDLVHALADQGLNGSLDVVLGCGRQEVELRLANVLAHSLLQLDDVLEAGVSNAQRLEHHVFRHFIGARFHHQDGVFGAGYPQIQGAVCHLAWRSG